MVYDSVECYRGADMVYTVRKVGGLKFQNRVEAEQVVRDAAAQGYHFSIRHDFAGYLVTDEDC